VHSGGHIESSEKANDLERLAESLRGNCLRGKSRVEIVGVEAIDDGGVFRHIISIL
jgi:hypothetical protein